jgi:NTE family protein
MGDTIQRNGSGGRKAASGKETTGKAISGKSIGLALAGGGPGGAIYEIGALRALEEALDSIDMTQLDVYVGVSAGAFISACLANQLSTAQMCRAIVKPEPGEHPFVPETFFTPAVGEIFRRSTMVPGLLFDALREYLGSPREHTLRESLTRLARALPVGVFANEPIRHYLEKIYTIKDRTDDFRELERKLIVVAADLDSGQAIRFGEEGWDHIPISKAVQASTALPGIYPPVEIEGRYYVDGVLLKTLHASVALDAGADLVLCINPMVPVDTVRAVEAGIMRRGNLIDRGLPSVLSQTFRTLIRSRLGAGMAQYGTRFGDRDLILLEPKRDDYEMFFRNIFSFRGRHDLCEHAYRATRAELRARADELEPILAHHGLRLRREVLEDRDRDLWTDVGLPELSKPPVLELVGKAMNRLPKVPFFGRRAGGTNGKKAPVAPTVSQGSSVSAVDNLDVCQRLDAALGRLELAMEERTASQSATK